MIFIHICFVTAAIVFPFKNIFLVISRSPQESLPFVNPVIGDLKKFYWSPIKVNDIRWNFEKFLITADGKPFKRYS